MSSGPARAAASRNCGSCGSCVTRTSSWLPARTPSPSSVPIRDSSAIPLCATSSPRPWMTSRPPISSAGEPPVTRIISGLAGDRRISTPPGSGTRPTSDRVREALFSRLEHLDVVHQAKVLDLYAGSGALGLEAASRGATSVLMVESDWAAVAAVRKNIAELGLPGVTIRAETVERVLLDGPPSHQARCDLVLADPPYDVTEEALSDVLGLLVTHEWLSEDAFVVVERSARSPEPRWPLGLDGAGERRYGETKMWFADFAGPPGVA